MARYKKENLNMNDNTYKLRRDVIALIHEAKKLVDLPRVTVRIAKISDVKNPNGEILGLAATGEKQIWIDPAWTASRAVVFHELLHAVFNVQHVAGCPLMDSYYTNPDDEVCNNLFVAYAAGKKLIK